MEHIINDRTQIARGVLARLEQAWNSADGAAFAAAFAPDADFVDVRGDVHQGRTAIAAGHQALFDAIYHQSTLRYTLLRTRQLNDGLILMHSTGQLVVPSGPAAGTHGAVQTLVVADGIHGWEVISFHNTPVVARSMPRPA